MNLFFEILGRTFNLYTLFKGQTFQLDSKICYLLQRITSFERLNSREKIVLKCLNVVFDLLFVRGIVIVTLLLKVLKRGDLHELAEIDFTKYGA